MSRGLRSGRGPSVGGMEEPVIERFEVMGPQPPEPDAAERRHDVSLDVAAVSGIRRSGEGDALAGQPAGGEKRAEGQSANLVVAALQIGCEVRGEALGISALCSGRVPMASLAPGDRIDAFVDHRVPAVALLCHVALQRTPPLGPRRPRTR